MGGTEVSPTDVLDRIESLDVETPDGATTTAYADFDRNFNVNAVAISLGLDDVVYDPDRFPGVIYRPDEHDAVVACFGNGIVFVESSGSAGVHDVVDAIADQLVELGLLDEGIGPSVDFETTPQAVPVPADYHDTAGANASSVACSNCGHDLSGDENFCPECGTEVESGCPDCGQELGGVENYCPECGTAVGGD